MPRRPCKRPDIVAESHRSEVLKASCRWKTYDNLAWWRVGRGFLEASSKTSKTCSIWHLDCLTSAACEPSAFWQKQAAGIKLAWLGHQPQRLQPDLMIFSSQQAEARPLVPNYKKDATTKPTWEGNDLPLQVATSYHLDDWNLGSVQTSKRLDLECGMLHIPCLPTCPCAPKLFHGASRQFNNDFLQIWGTEVCFWRLQVGNKRMQLPGTETPKDAEVSTKRTSKDINQWLQ